MQVAEFLRSACPLIVAALILGAPARAPAEGDPERGRVLFESCNGCHAIQGYSNAYPNYKVPKLEGQFGEYIVAALTGYRSGNRQHSTMEAQAASLSEQDIQDIGAWIGSLGVLEAQEPAGEAPETASTCVACHGQSGVSLAFAFPHLAGQHEDYLVQALKEYKNGQRSDVSMASFLATMTEGQMEELATFYARQPGLETLER